MQGELEGSEEGGQLGLALGLKEKAPKVPLERGSKGSWRLQKKVLLCDIFNLGPCVRFLLRSGLWLALRERAQSCVWSGAGKGLPKETEGCTKGSPLRYF